MRDFYVRALLTGLKWATFRRTMNENLMTGVGLFAHVAGQLPIKSDQTTPTQS